jgi:hypothetical protein
MLATINKMYYGKLKHSLFNFSKTSRYISYKNTAKIEIETLTYLKKNLNN